MADRLTQLQDCYEDLATQIFACQHYLQTRHPYVAIEGQPDMNNSLSSNQTTNGGGGGANGDNNNNQAQNASNDPDTANNGGGNTPDPTDVYQSTIRELARDLIIKEQQIEYLISVLPGIGNSEAEQNARIDALVAELRLADQERDAATKDRDQMLNLLGELAANCRRVY